MADLASNISSSINSFLNSLSPSIINNIDFIFLLSKIFISILILYIFLLIIIKLFKLRKERAIINTENLLQELNKKIDSLNNSLTKIIYILESKETKKKKK